MTNDTPPNSFFSMVTGKSDQELHAEGDEGRSVVAGDSHTSDDQNSKAPKASIPTYLLTAELFPEDIDELAL